MPRVEGRYVAPRKALARGKNHPLVCVFLMMDLLYKEWKSNGEDWEETLSAIRVLRGESPAKREDVDKFGTKMTFHTMNLAIRKMRDDWRAW